MKVENAFAAVQLELEQFDANREGMYNPNPTIICLPADAVRALLAGFEEAKSDIKAILVIGRMGGLGNVFCAFCAKCGRCDDCLIDSCWRGPKQGGE